MDKELNKVKMRGVLPSQGAGPIPVGKIPDGGTQVATSDAASGDTVEILTVTTGTTLYLTLLSFDVDNRSGGSSHYYITVTDGPGNIQYYLVFSYFPNGFHATKAMSFFTPLEIPAGYKIKVISGDANCYIMVFVHGYEA